MLATLMLVPVVYLTLALGRLQAGAYAAQGAAREAGRAFVTAQDAGSGQQRAVTAGAIAVQDQGFHAPQDATVRVDCAQVDCFAPDARVVVQAAVRVRLPGVPRFVDKFVPVQVQLTSTHIATVDRFRDRRAVRTVR